MKKCPTTFSSGKERFCRKKLYRFCGPKMVQKKPMKTNECPPENGWLVGRWCIPYSNWGPFKKGTCFVRFFGGEAGKPAGKAWTCIDFARALRHSKLFQFLVPFLVPQSPCRPEFLLKTHVRNPGNHGVCLNPKGPKGCQRIPPEIFGLGWKVRDFHIWPLKNSGIFWIF